MAVRSRLVGLPRFLTTLRSAQRGVADQSEPMLQSAELLARTISRIAPRRSGRLQGSPEPDSTPDTGTVMLPLEYTSYVNYGVPSHNMLPTRFVERARDIVTPAVTRRLQDGLQKVLDRVRGA